MAGQEKVEDIANYLRYLEQIRQGSTSVHGDPPSSRDVTAGNTMAMDVASVTSNASRLTIGYDGDGNNEDTPINIAGVSGYIRLGAADPSDPLWFLKQCIPSPSILRAAKYLMDTRPSELNPLERAIREALVLLHDKTIKTFEDFLARYKIVR